MTSVEDRLTELLHRAAAVQLDGVSVDEVARRARRRRRAAAAASATVISALAVGAVIAGAVFTGQRGTQPAATHNPKPLTESGHQTVVFHGIIFTPPNRWTTARPGCGWPANDTVVIDDHTGPVLYCPFPHVPTPLPTSVTLSTLYGPRYAMSWPGQRTEWHGQPAWLAVQTRQGATTVTLSLPWLNAAVAAESPDPTRARALLDLVSVRPGSGLEVPQDASSVFIQSLAGRDGNGQQRDATVTAAPDVQQLLADLRSLKPVESPRSACDGSWWPSTALLTVHDTDGSIRTYAARFGTCSQVIAGTGAAAIASNQLLTDVKRLVPNSGL
jgi:hypothetical protein